MHENLQFKVISAQENKENIEQICELIYKNNPNATIIMTLSPIPLRATFRDESIMIANTVSKSSLRVSIDEVYRNKATNHKMFYWPSFEIAQNYFGSDTFVEDNRHVKDAYIKTIMDAFAKYFIKE